jgi:hypothetical protein
MKLNRAILFVFGVYLVGLGYTTVKCFKAQDKVNNILSTVSLHQYHVLDRHEQKLKELK